MGCSSLTRFGIPLYRIGNYNDFGMRASIPALSSFLAVCQVKSLQRKPRVAALAMMLVLACGLPTSVGEVYREFAFAGFPMISVTKILATFLKLDPGLLSQYIVRLPVTVLRSGQIVAVHP